MSNPGPQWRTLTSVRVSLVWRTIAPLHQPCTIASLASTGTCNHPVCAPRLHPLQLLLPECICFKLLVPVCVHFSGCSPVVQTSAAAPRLHPLQAALPDCIRFKLLSPIAFASALLPNCTHFSKQLLYDILYASNIFSAFKACTVLLNYSYMMLVLHNLGICPISRSSSGPSLALVKLKRAVYNFVCSDELWDNEQAHDGLVRIFVAFHESSTAKDKDSTREILSLCSELLIPRLCMSGREGTVTFTP